VHRDLWRGQALYIRSLFEANRNIREPRQKRVSPSITPFARSGGRRDERPSLDGVYGGIGKQGADIMSSTSRLVARWMMVKHANTGTKADSSPQELMDQTQALLEKWKHPDPYRPPTAPGGSKYERNLQAPILDRTSSMFYNPNRRIDNLQHHRTWIFEHARAEDEAYGSVNKALNPKTLSNDLLNEMPSSAMCPRWFAGLIE